MEYDIMVGPIADTLKDTIVRQGLSLLGAHFACGPHAAIEAPEFVLDELRRLKVPLSRRHVHLHLRQSAEVLCRLGADERVPLATLSEAWRHLATATGENGHTLIDLSQCCGSHGGPTARGSLQNGL